jgi:hypothetical protein
MLLAGSVGFVLHSGAAASVALLPIQHSECGCKALGCGALLAGPVFGWSLEDCLPLLDADVQSVAVLAWWHRAQHCQHILCGSVL